MSQQSGANGGCNVGNFSFAQRIASRYGRMILDTRQTMATAKVIATRSSWTRFGSRPASGFDIWSYDIARGLFSRVTSDDNNEMNVLWSPDGREIAYTSSRDESTQILASRADGVGEPRRIVNTEEEACPTDWIKNDERILFSANRPRDIMIVRPDGSKNMSTFLATPFAKFSAKVSPDGRWIAYESNRSGRSEVYLRPFPEGDDRWQVSIAGGTHPVWSGDGSELFFHNGMRMFAVDVDGTGDTPLVGAANPLFEFTPSDNFYPQFDVSSDGQRFVVINDLTEQISDRKQLSMVLNWDEELSRLTSGSR